jgi:hypothetical protein
MFKFNHLGKLAVMILKFSNCELVKSMVTTGAILRSFSQLALLSKRSLRKLQWLDGARTSPKYPKYHLKFDHLDKNDSTNVTATLSK